jgi:hypothetical protein
MTPLARLLGLDIRTTECTQFVRQLSYYTTSGAAYRAFECVSTRVALESIVANAAADANPAAAAAAAAAASFASAAPDPAPVIDRLTGREVARWQVRRDFWRRDDYP